MSYPLLDLASILNHVPEDAPEATVVHLFSEPLLKALGFDQSEMVPQFDTGGGITDLAARKTIGDNIFLKTRKDPYLIVEFKGKEVNLGEGTAGYKKTVTQLKSQLLGEHAHSAQWGIITNSSYIQIFRKHGKAIFSASQCLQLTLDNINQVISVLKSKFDKPNRSLTVTVYDNIIIIKEV